MFGSLSGSESQARTDAQRKYENKIEEKLNSKDARTRAGGLDQVAGSGVPVWDNPATQANLIGVTASFTVHGSSPVIREDITLNFVTPIPHAAISTTPPGSQLANVVSVRNVP